MKIVSTMIQGGSGSTGSLTFSRNRYGYYVRSRVVPVNPATMPQLMVRANFADAMYDWRNALTDAQRAGWNAYGAAVAMTDRLGRTIFLPGAQHYARYAVLAKSIGAAVAADAPAIMGLGENDPSIAGTCAHTTSLSMAFDAGKDWVGDAPDGALIVYASKPQDPTINFFKGPFIKVGNTAAAPVSPLVCTLPVAPAAGQKIFWRARIIEADGRVSPLMSGVTIST